ncbi:hypothetical protein [Halobacterium yunchengense]|uniref:hypothetical protein n=1 Tax=Halobacterium yunchengense TaxID=3108497 RepID=UPI0030085987
MSEDDYVPEAETGEFPSEHERGPAEHVEGTLAAAEAAVQGSSYPTDASSLKARYATERDEVVNETEAPADAREAILGEMTGRAGVERGDVAEYDPERELDAIEVLDGAE